MRTFKKANETGTTIYMPHFPELLLWPGIRA